MKVTKKLREQAIMVASAEACNAECAESSHSTAALLDLPNEAGELAYQAWHAVIYGAKATGYDTPPFGTYCGRPEASAEAEALLRSGWSPGDPVTLRS